jgi:hypothetical protein
LGLRMLREVAVLVVFAYGLPPQTDYVYLHFKPFSGLTQPT